MGILMVELILWAALIFFFWALWDGLRQVESEIDALGLPTSGNTLLPATHNCITLPEKVIEPIGSYKDVPIYRYVFVGGCRYEFEHVCPDHGKTRLPERQCCLSPGLIYGRVDS